MVWYPSKPISYVGLSVPPVVGPTIRGWRCGFLDIRFGPNAIKKEDDRSRVLQTWLMISNLLGAFYAEIRKGQTPIKHWWWNGIPPKLGVAALVGPPYCSLWEEFCQGARKTSSGQYYAETLTSNLFTPLVCMVPDEIVQPPEEERIYDPVTKVLLQSYKYNTIQYPKVWPFEEPFSDG